jgi:succinyl-diaminopimelate desuccinylase
MTDNSPDSRHDVLALAQTLLRCPSVTPAEGGAITLLEALLKEAGFATHRLVFGAEEGVAPITNLYARYGTASPHLLWAGHTDVVPIGDEKAWTHPPFSAAIDNGELYGRGAVDMKGGVACMISATFDFLNAHPDFNGSIGFLITGDEEGPATHGTIKVLEWMQQNGETFDHCLLGEPTNPAHMGEMIKIGRRGSVSGHVVIHGTQGHVAYPHRADNPLHHLPSVINALISPLDQGTDTFDPSNLVITSIDTGNSASNVIPAEVTIAFNIRFNTLWNVETLHNECERRLAGAKAKTTLTFSPTNALPFVTEPDGFVHTLSDAIAFVTGHVPELSTSGGTSDARFICNSGSVVEFGLVGQTMHQVDERVVVADLETLKAIYVQFLTHYFKIPNP